MPKKRRPKAKHGNLKQSFPSEETKRWRLKRVTEASEWLERAKEAKRERSYRDMRFALAQAGIQFAGARNVLRTTTILRMLKGAEKKLRREGTKESLKEAEEIAEQIEEIKGILKEKWNQSSRSVPK